MTSFTKAGALWMALHITASLTAQDLLSKAAPQKGPIIFSNATIHTVSRGVILGGTIWFDGGKIQAVLAKGGEPKLPQDGPEPVRIDLGGKHVFPGMISPHTQLGLIEIGMVPQSVDTDELGEMSPEALAATAVNPDSTAIPVARTNGVLVAAVFPIGTLGRRRSPRCSRKGRRTGPRRSSVATSKIVWSGQWRSCRAARVATARRARGKKILRCSCRCRG